MGQNDFTHDFNEYFNQKLLYFTWVNLQYLEVWKSGHRTADLGSLNHTFFHGLKLPTLAVSWPLLPTAKVSSLSWEPKLPMCWKAAIKLPRPAVWGQKIQSAENWQSNCQGWQFENMAVKLPRSAVWVHKKKCGSNCQGRQFYGHFFKLPNMAGLPKWVVLSK